MHYSVGSLAIMILYSSTLNPSGNSAVRVIRCCVLYVSDSLVCMLGWASACLNWIFIFIMAYLVRWFDFFSHKNWHACSMTFKMGISGMANHKWPRHQFPFSDCISLQCYQQIKTKTEQGKLRATSPMILLRNRQVNKEKLRGKSAMNLLRTNRQVNKEKLKRESQLWFC